MTSARYVALSSLVALVPVLCASAQAAPSSTTAPWLFGIAPRQAQEAHTMAPLARLITQAAGHAIRVWHPSGSWFVYASDVANGRFALTWDGAIFTGWRDKYRGYHPIVRLSGRMRFLVVAPHDTTIHALRGLDGRVVCASPLPNMATMVLMGKTSQIMRPYIAPMGGVAQNYYGLVSGKCQAVILPSLFFDALSPRARSRLRIIYRTHGYPNLALSAGPQVPARSRRQIRHALLSVRGEALAARLFPGHRFVAPTPGAYQPYAHDLSRMTFFHDMILADQPAGHLKKTAITR